MEKRALIALVLSIFVLVIWQTLFVPKRQPVVRERKVRERPLKKAKVDIEKVPEETCW